MSRSGFTLIELLVATVLMALLAALTTKLVSAKGATAIAVMKSDLRNVASAQEAYFADHFSYASSLVDLDFERSKKVKIRVRGSSTGWSARTEHEIRDSYRCALYVGPGVTPFSPAVKEGVMMCSPKVGGGGCSGG